MKKYLPILLAITLPLFAQDKKDVNRFHDSVLAKAGQAFIVCDGAPVNVVGYDSFIGLNQRINDPEGFIQGVQFRDKKILYKIVQPFSVSSPAPFFAKDYLYACVTVTKN